MSELADRSSPLRALERAKAGRVPLGVKLAYTVWIAVWVPLYWRENGPANFLWICDFANFATLAALWAEKLMQTGSLTSLLLASRVIASGITDALQSGFDPFDVGSGMVQAPQA